MTTESNFNSVDISLTSHRTNVNFQPVHTSAQCSMTQHTASHVLERSHATRRLQTVLVIDKKDQKNLKVREMACADIEAIASSLNVNLQV